MTMAWSWVRVSCLVLLFSGCLAAVVNKETPEALVGPTDSTPTSLKLTSFTWDTDVPSERAFGSYKSLEVCFEEEQSGDDGDVYTLLIDVGGGVMTEYDSGVVGRDNKCATFSKVTGINPPLDKVATTYELHIANADGSKQQLGFTTFTVDQTKYDTAGKTFITCNETHYTRSDDTDCTDGVLLADETTCYQLPGPDLPTPQGCLTDDTATPNTVDVCLTDAAPVTAESKGKVVVNSLAYNGEAPDTGADVEIDYANGITSPKILEIIMQDITGEVPFNVGTCETTDPKSSCSIAKYTQAVVTYQVCAVAVDATPTVTSTASDKFGTITDLNLAVFDNGEQLEFGFKNANPVDRLYYAGVATAAAPETDAVHVGIDCTGVAPEHTCYGFLAASAPGGYNIKVGYGELNEGAMEIVSNTIIAPHTKAEPQE